MNKVVDWVRQKTVAACVSAAVVITALQVIMPTFIDLVLGSIVAGLVWVAGKAKK